eukprot:TRINITY_DN9864_c0_g1_i1.p2 TRINITY_DN9864_c0_g1~~TRINITY_DN9864_c0_g1_i1.p2  ORF type:complete len:176 (-),score=63.17 TRINITY_DN9864_c0_g1_i1:182-709(-)
MASVREVVKMGNPVLRKVAAEVEEIDSATEQLIADMKVSMHAAGGTGLAAPQVGESVRVIVYMISKARAEKEGACEVPLRSIVNPVLTPDTEEEEEDWEGCLSVPGLCGLVPRKTAVLVEGTDGESKQPISERVHGFHARVLQHEVDHLDGVMYIDRMRDTKKLIFTSERRHWSS